MLVVSVADQWICWDTIIFGGEIVGVIRRTLFESGDGRLICWDTTESENKFIGKSGTLLGSGDDRLICWDSTRSGDKIIGGIRRTLLVSGDDRSICWDATESESKFIGKSGTLLGSGDNRLIG